METPETRYVEVDGGYVAYQVTGTSQLDLLVVTSATMPIEAMTEPPLSSFIDRLNTFARVIRFDRRGCGMSDPIKKGGQWTLEHWMEDTLAVLDAVGAQRCAVFAVETPANQVAALLSAGHPERVSALVMSHPNARPRVAPDYALGMPPKQADGWAEGIQQWHLDGPSALTLQRGGNMTREEMDWLTRMRRRSVGPATLREMADAWVNSDIRDVLSAIRAPTLVVHRSGVEGDMTSSARSRDVAERVPNVRYIEVPGDSMYVYFGDSKPVLDEIEEFLTGVRPTVESDRVLATVLMTDIVESTSRSATAGDRAWRDLLDRHDAIVATELDRHRGKKVNSIGLGDGVLATFDGPARACRCACALHESIRASLGIDIRAGLHTGEIELRGDDVTGMAVNIAARVMNLADANETLVSRTVTDLVAGSGLEFEERGEHELKGVPGKWAIYAVRA